MDRFLSKPHFINQIFVVSGVFSTVLSCGLGLGYASTFLHQEFLNDEDQHVDDQSLRFIETAGEIAFVPSIVVIPYTMQYKGRRIASLATILPLLFSWIISVEKHFASVVIFNILHNISLGGVVTVSSIVISEYCSPKYRGMFLMLETAMISLGVLLSHVSGMYCCWKVITTLGILTAVYSFIVTYFAPESPYWLMTEGHLVKCTESFDWLRGQDEDAYRELETMLKTQKLKLQLDALRPIRKIDIKERIITRLKSLLKADFIRPFTIMILLFSFIGFGGENVFSSYCLRDLFKLSNGKYIGTIVLDVLSLVCSLAACVLVQIVRRKTLFLFTSSFSVIFLALASLMLFLQSIHILSTDYMWLFLSLVTGFVMFMYLGTTALPFSLLGEIFPMSYKGIGSSLTCAYLWAFGNSILKLIPSLPIGITLLVTVIAMALIIIILNKIMPETNTKTLLEIEQLMKENVNSDSDYEIVNVIEQDENMENHLDRLKLFFEV